MKKGLIFLSLILVLLGCQKSKVATGSMYFPLAAEGLTYIQLPVNSYFIYQDSATGNEDSVVVTTSSFEKLYVGGQGGLISFSGSRYYQVFTLKLKASNSLPNEYWFSGTATSYDSPTVFTLNTNNYSLNYPVFTYPTDGRFISSMLVEGHSFTNIEQNEIDNISSNPAENINALYYWAKDVGIIKRRITIGGITKTSSLKRHG